MLMFIFGSVIIGSIVVATYYVKTSPKRWMKVHGEGVYNPQMLLIRKISK